MRVIIILLALASLSACDRASDQPTTPATPAQLTYEGGDYRDEAAKLAHGKRLADVLDCSGCHSANLQGSDLADKPEDGAMYAPNITLLMPEYSDADLDQLLRHGVPEDGREFWFMPVESYQFLSDADAAALIAYLRTLKPAGKPLPAFKINKVEQTDVDQGLLGNAKVQIQKYRGDPPLDLGPQHAWGRYLAQTTCTACHNNALQGWERFTPDLDIAAAYSAEELEVLLTTGKGKSKADLGMMKETARRSLSKLTPRERHAIIAYVKERADRPK